MIAEAVEGPGRKPVPSIGRNIRPSELGPLAETAIVRLQEYDVIRMHPLK